MSLPPFLRLSGSLTLSPQAARYSGGPPDLGYHYDALDYTVANVTVLGGDITVLPGTAIGFRQDYVPALDRWTWWGFDLREGSVFVSRAFVDRPNMFVDVQFVQEQQSFGCLAFFLPDFFPTDENRPAPVMDFRFSRFHAPALWYHVWGGYDEGFIGYAATPDSLVNWTMRDCELRGGRINLGQPDDGSFFGAPWDWFYGVGSVRWHNNLFENVCVNLDPTYFSYDQLTMNCDLKVEANNNLFRGGQWLRLAPVPATEGNWLFTDNLFDKVDFLQDPALPLDFDHNGYWPKTDAELLWGGSSAQLQATGTNGPGGANDVALATAPAYEPGPFGGFYLATNSPLYNAGSRSPAEAGLHHYTTRPDHVKEGAEPAGHQVNIGLHYVAVTNMSTGCYIVDTDADGIPDFEEDANGDGVVDDNETSPLLASTDGMTNDIYSAVYDDIDLSGNGLVGRIKRALGLAPMSPVNPLTLTQITTGEEPDFATFEVPVSYDVVTQSGELSLAMNGIPVTLDECVPGTNGNCLLSFNVAYDPRGWHYLSARFRLHTDPPAELNPVMTATGGLVPFYSSNPVQFFEAGSMFDETGAYLDAKLFEAEADYWIELYDPSTTPPTLLKTITNSTTSGFIQEDWDLMQADGVTVFTNSEVQAVFNVAYASESGQVSTNKPRKHLTRAEGALSEWGPNMNVVYFRGPTNDVWTSEFAKNGVIWNGMQGVVDALIKPVWDYDVYQSSFNRYLPDSQGEYPGYITKRSRSTNDPVNLPTVMDTLLPDMTNGLTKQIYIYGHGNSNHMGNYNGTAYITAHDVGSRLKNTYTRASGLTAHNPYRFVWLDGCATASGKDWRRAFGIYPIGKGAQEQASRNMTGPQAYVGWEKAHAGMLNRRDKTQVDVDLVEAYTRTLNLFYTLWMRGTPVKGCIDAASEVNPNRVPLPVPKNRNMTLTINSGSYQFTNVTTSRIFIVGYPGLTVNGRNQNLDSDKTYAAPENIE